MSAFYLKYRPQQINDLDLKSVREQLGSILSKKSIPHAYLFSGPKGLGKTSSARIFTKAINCLNREKNLKKGKFEPCNKCAVCQSINNASAIDLLEIDAASNRGIDDIRSLKEKIKLLPSVFKRKVYVIDEVHMLTVEAFNALLKTLEEPPPHSLFILCTTNPEKIPATILSRVLRVRFAKPEPKELKRSLQRVIKGEGLKIDAEALELIVQNSEDSFRDAHKLLEQLSFMGKKISIKQVEKLVGSLASLSLNKFWTLLSKKDVNGSLTFLWDSLDKGIELKLLQKKILNDLRSFLLGFYNLGLSTDLFSEKEVKKLIKLFYQAGEYQNDSIASLGLEMAVLEFIGQDNSVNGDSELKEVKEEINPAKQFGKKSSISLDQFKDKWSELLSNLQPKNHSVTALLRSCRPAKANDDFLTIEVYYEFHKSRLENDRINQMIKESLFEIFGSRPRINYVLGDRKPVKKNKNPSVSKNEVELIQTAEELFERG